jgi:hypothetical protein
VADHPLRGEPVGNARRAAQERSQELLRSWLSPDQRRQYDVCGSFEVVGCDTGKRYQISRSTIYNIEELDELGRPSWALWLSRDDMPTGDLNLAQKIALENFENRALAVANRGTATVWRQVESPSSYRDGFRRLTAGLI